LRIKTIFPLQCDFIFRVSCTCIYHFEISHLVTMNSTLIYHEYVFFFQNMPFHLQMPFKQPQNLPQKTQTPLPSISSPKFVIFMSLNLHLCPNFVPQTPPYTLIFPFPSISLYRKWWKAMKEYKLYLTTEVMKHGPKKLKVLNFGEGKGHLNYLFFYFFQCFPKLL
jgi:hypothetical protein